MISKKPVIQRKQAEQDIDNAVNYYQEISPKLANSLIDDLERAFKHISTYPATGATRYAYELNLPSLRSWILKRFPYMIFYIEKSDHIDVWRVVHSQGNIPSWLQEMD